MILKPSKNVGMYVVFSIRTVISTLLFVFHSHHSRRVAGGIPMDVLPWPIGDVILSAVLRMFVRIGRRWVVASVEVVGVAS